MVEERKETTRKIKEEEEKEENGQKGIHAFWVCLPLKVAPEQTRLSGADVGAALEKRTYFGSF